MWNTTLKGAIKVGLKEVDSETPIVILQKISKKNELLYLSDSAINYSKNKFKMLRVNYQHLSYFNDEVITSENGSDYFESNTGEKIIGFISSSNSEVIIFDTPIGEEVNLLKNIVNIFN
jgi:hypothetical protein